MNNRIYLRRCGKIFLESGSETLDPTYLAALQKNLESLGYSLSPELAEVLMTQSIDKLGKIYRALIEDLKAMLGAKVAYAPMYPDFPEQLKRTPQLELYLNAMLHYWGDAIGRRILPGYVKSPRPPLQDQLSLKAIGLGSKAEFNGICTQQLSARSSLSTQDCEDLEYFVKNRGESISALIPAEIPQRENLAYLGALLLQHTSLGPAYLQLRIGTATDLLRVAVALSRGDISLAKASKFKSLSKRQRRLLLERLEALPDPIEDMLRWTEPWKRLGERLHPGEYRARYPKAWQAFEIIRSGLPYPTFYSQVEAALAQNNTEAALALLRQRPGELARRLDRLLRSSKEPERIIAAFAEVAAKVSTPVLLQVMTHFEHRNDPNLLRVFLPKGQASKLMARANDLAAIEHAYCSQVVSLCREALIALYREREALGKVWIDPALAHYTVPFALRSASKALRTVARGTRLPLPPGDTLRFFIWWRDGSSRTDLDLSAVALDAEHEHKFDIAYYNLTEVGGYHSGDLTSAPEGASEFIDIHLPTCLAEGIRYVMMSINSFTQQAYCNLPECYAGFMMRQEANSGEIYEPATVSDRFDLSADSTIAVPLIFDLQIREALWVDISLREMPDNCNNVHNNLSSLTLLSMAMQSLHKPSLQTLFDLHQQARGTVAANPAEADTVFGVAQGITPFDPTRIIAEFL